MIGLVDNVIVNKNVMVYIISDMIFKKGSLLSKYL